MSISSEITRLYDVRGDILQAIADKGVTVPSGSKLADCPELIAAISGGGGFDTDGVVNIVPIDKIVVVDSNGYIGYDLTNYFQMGGTFYYNYAILSAGDDFSDKGIGQVTFYTPSSNNIGGRDYNTVIIGGREWLAENLDFKFSGLEFAKTGTSSSEPRGNYYQNDEATYGINGNKYGLLYNYVAVKYLEDNKSQLIPGWHVPTADEWDALAMAVGGDSVAGTNLKSTSGWSSGNGNGSTAFAAFPAGNYGGTFNDIGNVAFFWTVSGYNSTSSKRRRFGTSASMYSDYGDIFRQYSVRLVKDSA